jgi:hypothetical protein
LSLVDAALSRGEGGQVIPVVVRRWVHWVEEGRMGTKQAKRNRRGLMLVDRVAARAGFGASSPKVGVTFVTCLLVQNSASNDAEGGAVGEGAPTSW